MAIFSSSSSSTPETSDQQSSAEIKNALIKQVQTEAAVTNARALVAVRYNSLLQESSAPTNNADLNLLVCNRN